MIDKQDKKDDMKQSTVKTEKTKEAVDTTKDASYKAGQVDAG